MAKPWSASTPSPIVASTAASQVGRGMRRRRMSAVSSGVATTYSPVTKPETLAAVCESPAVCRICADP